MHSVTPVNIVEAFSRHTLALNGITKQSRGGTSSTKYLSYHCLVQTPDIPVKPQSPSKSVQAAPLVCWSCPTSHALPQHWSLTIFSVSKFLSRVLKPFITTILSSFRCPAIIMASVATLEPVARTARHPHKTRKRAPKACLSCRARKVRCDVSQRGRPCMNCYLDDEACVVTSRASRL